MKTLSEIEEMVAPLMSEYQKIYYVYQAFVDGELRYIGKGKGNRMEHCKGGTSSCSELNRDFHMGKNIEVVKYREGLLESEADYLEMHLISENMDKGIYNKKFKIDYSSKPNFQTMKGLKILGEGRDDKLIKHLCKISPEISKHYFEQLQMALNMCELSLYLVRTGDSSSPILIIDKPRQSDYDVQHKGCKNWPNCDTVGCGEW